MILTIDKFGRILIPKVLRQVLEVEPGDNIDFNIDEAKRQMSIRKAVTPDDAVIAINSWGFPTVSLNLPEKVEFNVADHVASIRQEYLDRKLGIV